jgi:tripartite-type tricarboxylate transporter receptor subunit TctC
MLKHRLSHLCAAGVLVVGFGMAPQPASSGGWPERTVRIITPFGPGISPDVAARTLADALTKRWKQSVIVENRSGADTMLGTQAFLEMRDDHALLFTTHSTFTVVPLLRAKVPYDPVGDVKPISLAVEDYLTVAVSRTLPVGTLSDFVTLAREKPTKLNFYAAPGAPYLAYLAFQKRAGIDTTFVAYNSPVNAISDLSEERIHIAVMPLASVLGAVQAGKVKLLAVANAERTPAAPDVPTVAESGYPEFTFGGFLGLFGPKDMPAELRERIASDVRAILKESDIQQRLTNVGLIARGTTPAEFETIIEAQRIKWAAIAREHNIEPQ